jgi:hypothetical protein
MGVFGKSAAEILPLLNEGADGIEKFQKEAERLGLVMSDDMAASAAAAGDAIDTVMMAASAAAVKFGAALAPAVTIVAKVLSEIVASSPGLIQAFAGGAVALAAFVGAMKVLNVAMDLYAKRQVIVLALSGPKGWIALAGAAVIAGGAIAALTSQFGSYNTELAQAQQNQKALAEGNMGAAGPTAGSTEAQSRLVSMQDELRVLRGELTQFDLQMEKLAQAGATEREIKQLRFLEMNRNRVLRLQDEERKKQALIADEVERAAAAAEQQQKAMQSRAESIIESLKTPADKFLDRQSEIQQLQAKGLLTDSQASRAIDMARKDILGAGEQVAETQRPQAMQAGSQEAFRAILQAMGKQDPQVQAVNKMNQNIAKKLDSVTDAILTIQTAGIA